MGNYVIITPAHNEESFFDKTIDSVVNQTILPLKWIVVNDGSNDRTGEIVERCKARYNFVELINVERSGGRHFGNKVKAFRLGLDRVHSLAYDYIGNLDADICLEPRYYEGILSEFEKDPMLGVAGGIVYTNIHGTFATYDTTLDSVGGAVQLFRRTCFDDIGGYPLLESGGIDAAAEIMARMLGWKVRKFPRHKVFELRRTGSAQSWPLIARVQEGRKFYSLGYGFLFYFVRCLYRSKHPPFLIGSIAALCGFMISLMRRRPILLPTEVLSYLKSEQRQRLKRLLGQLLNAKSYPASQLQLNRWKKN
jgi:glycosyltransferase involved in cell wall biosynthesis